MLTVLEAARSLRRNPETIRRWIRTGRLKARKVGNQHLIDEEDLAEATGSPTLNLPREWAQTSTGEPLPDVLAVLRASRARR